MESDGEGLVVEKGIAKEVTKELAVVKIRRKNIPNAGATSESPQGWNKVLEDPRHTVAASGQSWWHEMMQEIQAGSLHVGLCNQGEEWVSRSSWTEAMAG